jgi:hypothetical protein
LLSIASLALCAIVIVSFAIFVIDETKTGSAHQQQQLGAEPAPSHTKESSVHKAIDDASSTITSPFSSVVSASSGEWADRGAKLGLALVIYGFGLGFLARMLRVRV